MAKKKTTAKKAAKQKSFEETLWDTANKLRGSVESSDWSGATKTTRQGCPQGCPQGERGGTNQNGSPLLHSSFSLLTSLAKGEGEIRQKLVENDLVDCRENKAYPLAA